MKPRNTETRKKIATLLSTMRKRGLSNNQIIRRYTTVDLQYCNGSSISETLYNGVQVSAIRIGTYISQARKVANNPYDVGMVFRIVDQNISLQFVDNILFTDEQYLAYLLTIDTEINAGRDATIKQTQLQELLGIAIDHHTLHKIKNILTTE